MTVTPNPAPQVQFAQAIPPALESNDYTLTLTQTVTAGSGAPTTYQQSYPFTVAGPRFALDSSGVYAQFPPAGGRGIYASFLPQVILPNASLPWSRMLSPNEVPTPGTVQPPFVGLLVLGPDDFGGDAGQVPNPVGQTVGDLLATPSATLLTPAYESAGNPDGINPDDLDAGESLTDPCSTVDIPISLFTTIAPSQQDLALLAHVRSVDQTVQQQPPATPEGWFAAVVANRFPVAGTTPGATGGGPATSQAYLVSFEGLLDFLPGGDQVSTLDNYNSGGAGAVRLCVLASWSFTDISGMGVSADFDADISSLDPQPIQLPTSLLTVENSDAESALNQGFVALNHITRQGETTAAFYRGPLVPLPVPLQVSANISDSEEAAAPLTWSCSDAALRFDTTLGVFDTSYAAAWTLGRMLALQNVQFAQALQNYRRSIQVSTTTVVSNAMTASSLPGLNVTVTTQSMLSKQPFRRALAEKFVNHLAPLLTGTQGHEPAFGHPANRLSKSAHRARAHAAGRRKLTKPEESR